jgi:hypothetical protein
MKTAVEGGIWSTYSTALNTYNVRDQVTSIKAYQGAATIDGSCPAGTCLQTITNYDGHGRPGSSKNPDESGFTTYEYYDALYRTKTDK